MGNDLIVYDPASVQSGSPKLLNRFRLSTPIRRREPLSGRLLRPSILRQDGCGRLSRWSPVGQAATDRFDKLQAAADYTEAYFVHGLAVQTAEAAADYLHAHIINELGLL